MQRIKLIKAINQYKPYISIILKRSKDIEIWIMIKLSELKFKTMDFSQPVHFRLIISNCSISFYCYKIYWLIKKKNRNIRNAYSAPLLNNWQVLLSDRYKLYLWITLPCCGNFTTPVVLFTMYSSPLYC